MDNFLTTRYLLKQKAANFHRFNREWPGDKITLLPFYGGAKGQSLQIIEKPDGSVVTTIINTPHQIEDTNFENNINPTELENPPLPTKFDTEDFSDNLRKIQGLAVRIIKLQEVLKETGKLTSSEETAYRENLETLSESAQKLADIQEGINPISIENREGLSAWIENRKSSTSKTKTKKKEGEDLKKKEDDKKRKAEEQKKKDEEKRKEEKRKQEELDIQKKQVEKQTENEEKEENNQGEKEEQEGDHETIGIDLPPEDASVAEAKPIGLAVAGVGGVASSKPIATAVVGPGGLAIARPVGTAIAGVDPEQALVPIHAGEFVLGSKPHKSGSSEKANEYLSRIISKFHQK